jgi:HK97 family phage major capsid protein
VPTISETPLQEVERLRQERVAFVDQMSELTDRADNESRDLHPDENKRFVKAESDFNKLSSKISKLEAEHNLGAKLTRSAIHGGIERTRRKDGGTLLREERTRDWAVDQGPDPSGFTAEDADQFCIGNIMRAMTDSSFRDQLTDVEARALAEGVDSTGGFWTPEILSTSIIDRVRNEMTVMKAGATTVPLSSDKQSIPRLSGGVTGAWRNENAAFADTTPAFDRVDFAPKSYGFIVKTSEELYQDMVPGGGAILENEFTAAAALELDRAALRGSGTPPEPKGVRFQTGVTLQSLGANGATPTYPNLQTAATTLRTANREPNGIITAPRTDATYGGLTDTTGQPLQAPRTVSDLPVYTTNQIPVNLTQGSSSDTSETYVGYWPDLLIGIRLGIQLRLLTERYADTGQYAWRIFLRADIQLRHPESFVVLTGVRP